MEILSQAGATTESAEGVCLLDYQDKGLQLQFLYTVLSYYGPGRAMWDRVLH